MQTLKFVCLDCMDFKYEDLGGTTERIVRQLQSL
jgi:hypothetical protein